MQVQGIKTVIMMVIRVIIRTVIRKLAAWIQGTSHDIRRGETQLRQSIITDLY